MMKSLAKINLPTGMQQVGHRPEWLARDTYGPHRMRGDLPYTSVRKM